MRCGLTQNVDLVVASLLHNTVVPQSDRAPGWGTGLPDAWGRASCADPHLLLWNAPPCRAAVVAAARATAVAMAKMPRRCRKSRPGLQQPKVTQPPPAQRNRVHAVQYSAARRGAALCGIALQYMQYGTELNVTTAAFTPPAFCNEPCSFSTMLVQYSLVLSNTVLYCAAMPRSLVPRTRS